MISLSNIAKSPTNLFMISLMTTISTVFGCGVMPAGQGSTINFTVTGFTLPVAMVYSTATDVQAQVPGIATTEAGARGFVERLVMQTVFDVLESQGRSALLPDTVISVILGQLNLRVTYEPLMCPIVRLNLMNPNGIKPMERACIIVDKTVTAICTYVGPDPDKPCNVPMDANIRITPVSGPPSTISGTLSTTNTILANWPRAMWQSVMNRAVRVLASRPFGSHFFSATATVGGS
ncbi:hypothetical protein KIN20_012477 [Parelaphostrongylus tenuis]|uniref:Uncharacterized protein n=1 Tax=Parelaphostrongylus tenuis TaxID=148309 RepID=A0AAD5N133_PARTN|nr:hypothetical protein KIN20_012477 [Parelaphostrongylus tenuis]